VAGDESLRVDLARNLEEILYGAPPHPDVRREVRAMRARLESSARGLDVKRGFGGLVDIEFVAEALKLLHGHRLPSLRTTGTLPGLAAARREGLLGFRDYETLLTAMQFLRSVESRMRIVYDMAQDRIPDDAEERGRLARRLGYVDTDASSAGDALLDEYDYHTARTRQVFLEVLGESGE
jgi:glutamate-ammonia-ligase adenylyltransferase